MTSVIRALDPVADRARVAAMMDQAADYYRLWLGHPAGEAEVHDFFTGAPPEIDPATSRHLGLFVEGHLAGIAQMVFGFPTSADPYLGLMILAPQARGQGHGPHLLAHVEEIARATGAPTLYLAVLRANPRGRAFWERMGFAATGVTRTDNSHGQNHTVYRLAKAL